MPDSFEHKHKKYKILVVDDMVFTIEVIIGYLNENEDKYEIFQATNGEMACKVAMKKLPDLIIMDWEMPVMSGLDAVKFLKSKTLTKGIPIIMATALTSSESLKKALEAGAVDYVRKPIDKVELLARISIAIELSESYKKIKIFINTLVKQKEEILSQNKLLNEQKDKIEEQKLEITQQSEILRETNKQLIELDDFKEGLTGMLVHDLKNPLNTIIGLSESGSIINQAGNQMLTMVSNMLDVQKYEKTLIPLDLNNYAAFDLLSSALSQVNLLRETKNIELINRVPKTCNLLVDKELLQRVFVNLLANAIKFTPNNGKIIIQAGKTNQLSGIEFDSEKFELMSVTDSGVGISSDKIHFVFDKFTQVIAKKSGNTRSTGLGLTFCKMVVEAHNGEIGVISKSQQGTTFWFTVEKAKILTDSFHIDQHKDINEKEMSFSQDELEILEPIITQLQNYEVFDISAIKEVMKRADNLDASGVIREWKKQLKFAITSCNEAKYDALVFK